jgi:hypothetical protein
MLAIRIPDGIRPSPQINAKNEQREATFLPLMID